MIFILHRAEKMVLRTLRSAARTPRRSCKGHVNMNRAGLSPDFENHTAARYGCSHGVLRHHVKPRHRRCGSAPHVCRSSLQTPCGAPHVCRSSLQTPCGAPHVCRPSLQTPCGAPYVCRSSLQTPCGAPHASLAYGAPSHLTPCPFIWQIPGVPDFILHPGGCS